MNRQDAIDAKCKDCNWDSNDVGTWREQVESCKAKDCSLWEHRPMTKSGVLARQEEKMSQMTPAQLENYKARQERARENMKKIHSAQD
jgi:hypothetical protein